jgi:hypothetical protein
MVYHFNEDKKRMWEERSLTPDERRAVSKWGPLLQGIVDAWSILVEIWAVLIVLAVVAAVGCFLAYLRYELCVSEGFSPEECLYFIVIYD